MTFQILHDIELDNLSRIIQKKNSDGKPINIFILNKSSIFLIQRFFLHNIITAKIIFLSVLTHINVNEKKNDSDEDEKGF